MPGRMQSTSDGTLVVVFSACVLCRLILQSSESKPAQETDTHDGSDGKKSSKGEKNREKNVALG